jgi:hypothetical protein
MDFGSDSDGDDAFRWDLFEQTALIQRRVNELFDFEPKDKQVEAIRKLLYDKSDLILIAKTGFGKSLIFQALPLIQEELKLALNYYALESAARGAASLGRSWEKTADYFHQTGLDCSKRGCEVRPLRGAMIVSKVKNITINNNDHITEVFTGMFI